jgi:outer membrane protein assembly factor BamB
MSVPPRLTAWSSQHRRAAAGLTLALVVTVIAACGTSSGATGASRTTPTPTQLPTATAPAPPVAPAPSGVYFAASRANSTTVYALDTTTGTVRWSTPVTQGTGGWAIQIVSTGDILVIVDAAGNTTARRMEDGAVVWTHARPIGGRSIVTTPPVADNGILFVSSSGDSSTHGYLDAYRAADGAHLWEHDEGLNSAVYLGAANGVLYANMGMDQQVDALRGTDGTTLWQAKLSGPVTAPPIATVNAIYLNNYGEVYALNAATGALLWQYKPPQVASSSDLTVSVGGGLVFASNSTRLNVLHASDGTLAWYAEYHQLVEGPSYANGVVYVSGNVFINPLYALNPSDGSQRWSVHLHGNSSWPALLQGDTLYLSRSDTETTQPAGYLYALNPTTGAVRWEYTQSGGSFSNAIVA